MGTWERLRRVDHRIWGTLVAFVMLVTAVVGARLMQGRDIA